MNNFLFVNTHFPPDVRYGGVVESGSKLFKYLSKNENWSALVVSKDPNKIPDILSHGKVFAAKSILFHSYGFSINFIFLAFKKIKSCDFVFVNGTITFPTIISQFFCVILKKPFGVSLRGTLGPYQLKYKKWKKYLYYKIIIIPLLKKANFIHTTCEFEKTCAIKFNLEKIVTIPNGIDLDEFGINKKSKTTGLFTFLFLSRLDKEKGVDILIEAYKLFRKKNPHNDHQLLIVGPDNKGYFKQFFPLESNIIYYPGAYGKEKLKFYQEADFFILPSYTENFGNVIAESLACSLPVITTTGVPWSEIVEWDCGYYVNPNCTELLQAMDTAFKLSTERIMEMGKNGRKLIINKYQWYDKAEKLSNYIHNLLITNKSNYEAE